MFKGILQMQCYKLLKLSHAVIDHLGAFVWFYRTFWQVQVPFVAFG